MEGCWAWCRGGGWEEERVTGHDETFTLNLEDIKAREIMSIQLALAYISADDTSQHRYSNRSHPLIAIHISYFSQTNIT